MANPAAGNLATNESARDGFISWFQTPVHGEIVYHKTAKHDTYGDPFVGTVGPPPDDEYDDDNPPSGVTPDGFGADGTIMNDDTVYNAMKGWVYTLTNIRLAKVEYRRFGDNNTYVVTKDDDSEVTVLPAGDHRQDNPDVGRAGVEDGYNITAGGFEALCNNFYTSWQGLRDNEVTIIYNYCHTSCHTSCHSSRGRR